MLLAAVAEHSGQLPLDLHLRSQICDPNAMAPLCAVLAESMPPLRDLNFAAPALERCEMCDFIRATISLAKRCLPQSTCTTKSGRRLPGTGDEPVCV
ncbi:hypothetical protein AURDEDRAFT_165018 [Auricularia subglabra TFB-10046 SS5]|nr:hypothetical protein AURDEDRAFT_165018 [Auricularia subglabra TFB-10046 SS5]